MNRSTSRSVLAGLVVVGGIVLVGCGAGQIAQTAQQRPTVDGQQAQVGQIGIRDAALEYPSSGLYERGADARLRMVVVNSGPSPDVLTSVSSTAAGDVTISQGTSAGATGTASPSAAASSSGPATFSSSPTPSGTASGTPTGTAEPPQSSESGGAPSASASSSAGASPSGSGSAGATPSPTPTPTQEDAQVQIPANSYVSFTGDGPTVLLTGLTDQLYPTQNVTVTLTFQNAGSVTMTIAVSSPEGEISPAPTVTVEPDSESEG